MCSLHWSRVAFVTEEGGHESTVWRYRFEAVDAASAAD